MEIDEITKWLWCLRTPLVHAYAVRHGGGVSLIDTTTAGREDDILALLADALGTSTDAVRLREILLTHGHNDHTGSAAALARRTGARVLGPALEADIIEGRRARDEPQLLDWEIPIFEQIMPQVPPAPPVTLDQRLQPGDTLAWDVSGQLIAAPGHTPGQLVAWFPAERVLIAADAMASHDGQPMPGVFNVDPRQAALTYTALAALRPNIACFGHGEPLVGDVYARLR